MKQVVDLQNDEFERLGVEVLTARGGGKPGDGVALEHEVPEGHDLPQ